VRERVPTMKYAEKLLDPRWQKLRLEIFDRDGWTCQRCKETTKTLCVHHIYYMKGLDPWEYPKEILVTLCEDCHGKEKTDRPQSEARLLTVLKEIGFSAGGIDDLVDIFESLELEWGQDHLINALYNIIKHLPEVPFADGIRVTWNNG